MQDAGNQGTHRGPYRGGVTSLGVAVAAMLVLIMLLGGCASSGPSINDSTPKVVTPTDSLPAPDSTSASGAYLGVPDYRVGPLDLIEVTVFQVEELNRTVRVNTSGKISLPLVGTIDAGGKTVSELEADIASRLEETYLQSPQVSVFVKEFTSQRVTIEGAVKQPGVYPITGRTSLLQAVAMAKGFERVANLEGVIVFRTVDGQRMAAVFDYRAIRAGQVEDPQIYGDDIVVVDESGPKAAWRNVLEALPIFNVFRPY